MPTTANTINYYIAEDGTLRDGSAGSIAQTPRIYYGTEYAVTLSFPPSTIAKGDQLQVALNRTRTFFSSASATGDAPVAAVSKHTVTEEEATTQAVTLTLSTNTRAMIDQVNGIDHPVRGFFGVHVLRGQSFVTLAVADALMMSLESGPDAISPPLPILDYPTRQEMNDAVEAAQNSASAAKTSEDNADASASAAARDAQAAGQSATNAGNSATLAESYAVGGTGTRPGEDTDNAKYYLEQLGDHEANAAASAEEASAWAEGTPQQVSQYGGTKSAKGWATDAQTAAGNAADYATDADNAKTASETAQGKAETAQGKAETAQGKAETAQGKAEDAQTAAEAAQTAAETAQGKAETAETNAAGSASDASSYATAAAGSASAALASATKAAIVTEGTDEQVAEYGLEHSAKTYAGIAQEAAEDATAYLDVITIPSSTAAYTLQDNRNYEHKPSAVPTYTLPTVVFDNKKHEISLLVDFMHVTSCSFVDAGGVPVTLQSAISPQIGEAYVFRCYWYGKWRVVPLKIRNAATATSSNGVVEVTDAVAGDALALRMTAPRSVVVNQLVQNGNFADNSAWTARYGSLSVSSNKGIYTASSVDFSARIDQPIMVIAGHVYFIHYYVTAEESINVRCGTGTQPSLFGTVTLVASVRTLYAKKEAAGSNSAILYLYNQNISVGKTVVYEDVRFIDLTQYFNGDSALIDSIQSWDDLVAYDPRFASYVEYNTGEVVGVTPTVKVCGKNLCDFQRLISNGAVLQSDGSLYIEKPQNFTRYTIYIPNNYTGQVTLKYDVKYISNGANGLRWEFLYADGTVWTDYPVGDNEYHTRTIISDVSKKLRAVRTTYGSYSIQTYWKNIQIELGSSATSYEPYHDGGTAQAPAPLFAVGNAADEHEAVAGVTTRKMKSVNWTQIASDTSLSTSDEVNSSGIIRYIFYSIGKRTGVTNCISSMFLTSSNVLQASSTVEGVSGVSYNTNLLLCIKADRLSGDLSTSTQRRTALINWATSNNFAIYYERDTPTTSQSTPTQIALQAGNNVAMQTDGGRTLAELAMTYENLPAAD